MASTVPGPSGAVYTDPVRYPQSASPHLRSKRAFLLLFLTLVLPGSAQIVAGDRRLGRTALRVTFLVWAALIAVAVVAVTNRVLLVSIFTNSWASFLIMALLAGLAVGWALLFLNTFRIIRPPLLQRNMRPAVAGAMALLMVLTSGSLAYGAWLLNVSRQTFDNIFASGPAFDPVDGRYNFLLLGGDAGADRTGLRPDSMSVFSVDADTGQIVTFSLPRNFQNTRFTAGSPLWQVFPEGYNCGDECILNSLYPVVTEQYPDLYPESEDPGAEAMMDAAGGILGLEIQSYVIVDMEGFSSLIDAMGGVKIDVGGWVPITAGEIPGTNRHYPPDGWIAPGVQTMDGYTALWYARSREFVTDFHRIARQQCVQQAMVAQLDPATLLTRFQAIASAGEEVVHTDIPQDQLGSFVDLALKSKDHEVQRMTIGPPDFGTAADNFATYPDFDLIHSRVQEKLAKSAAAAEGTAEEPAPEPVEDGAIGSSDPAEPEAPAEAPTAPAPEEPPVPAETAGPEITEDYLQELARIGDTDTLAMLLDNNGACSVG
ncbi:LCP family protein [Arthrobacter gandavensis]|uniref:LCP family protein n=1 Tax=Arthrobacter gandavensis TaxID=169960 RepID=UPI00188F9DAD|nr:LCP family protein [Arthrobacter gandavensis]MBF4993057.1 LCP family protein [Arthrobacter gandavensis]